MTGLKKIMAVLLLIVLGSQSLPMRQIGRFLFNSTLSEELPHDMDSVKDDCCKWAVPPVHHFDGIAPSLLSDASIGAYIHYAAALPANYSGDIQTPPPNC